jgi:peptide/nickel transport system ATP-binding protein
MISTEAIQSNEPRRELLQAEGIVKHFPARGALFYNEKGELEHGEIIHAVDGVNLVVRRNSTLGIVGESGCGKTTLARTIMLLTKPTAGRIFLEGTELTKLSYGKLSKFRPDFQMVFQDPFSSLDPRMRARDIVAEPLRVVTKKRVYERVEEVFGQVGLDLEQLGRFPNEFSGGQRQRIAIARAIASRPKLVVLDEPTSALDVSTQAQILNLLSDIQEKNGVSYIFISHNVTVVRRMSDRIGVMYLGQIVEEGTAEEITKKPMHPYTTALISSVPKPNPRERKEMVAAKGETPSPINPPSGCRYHPRCPYAKEKCSEEGPRLEERKPGHLVACYYPLN